MKKTVKKMIAAASAGAVLCGSLALSSLLSSSTLTAVASESIADQTEVDTLGIAGGGFVSGIVTGETTMYARTDVGGAYKYDYDAGKWVQMLDFIDEEDRGLLSIDAMCLDPNDENTIYMLAGCAYFSAEKTVIFRSRDGGETFDEIDVTKMIQVHGNGDGRHLGEAIAVDPDNPNIIYCGGDVTAGGSALIMSEDGGDTWQPVKGYDDLGYFSNSIKWPTWTSNMVRALTTEEYNHQNGIALVHIQDGKVYVGTTMAAEGNLVVADVGSDNFEVLSADLPTDVYPSRINVDADGNLLISYVAGPAFGNGSGGVYRYNPTTGAVKNISPVNNSIGACVSAPDNANELIATTCAVWSSQSWADGSTTYGEWLYRSEDGGETWTSIYPGKMSDDWYWDEEAGAMKQPQLYAYLNDGGHDWIQGKAIHWSGSLVLNPQDPTEIWVTSGNGVFEWENIWTEDPQAIFHADGIEEVVALDMISPKDKNPYSVIGDYDGFEHVDKVNSNAFTPTMSEATEGSGSASAIAYCPQNSDVMLRCSEGKGVGYYTLDGGKNWTKMDCPAGGKAAITQLEDGSYRFLKSSGENSTTVSYSDDYGATWTTSTGIASAYGSKPTFMLVEESDPSIVYAYATYYNSSWFYSKTEPDITDACYKFYVSHDYGATFTEETDIAMYDQCDSAGRIAVLGDGELVLGAGWYGAYRVSDYGKQVEELNVSYCKTIGYGAPEKEGDVNTLYMYGKPQDDDAEGVYRSTDAGKTWVLINSDHLYGGTGNGNFLVGDMNEFGTVYMSTVGCGIVYMQSAGGTDPKPITTTATTTTTTDETTTTTSGTGTTTSDVVTTTSDTATTTGGIVTTTSGNTDDLIGDTNLDGKVDLLDAICLNKHLAQQITLDGQAYRNANCDQADGTPTVDEADGTALISYVVMLITKLPVME